MEDLLAEGESRLFVSGCEVSDGDRLLFTCAGVSDGCTDSMSAAVPATSGAEKLVPSEVSKLSL